MTMQTEHPTTLAPPGGASAVEGHVIPQRYEDYPEWAHANWQRIVKKAKKGFTEHRDYFMPVYLEGLERLALDPDRVPRLSALDERLAPIGWRTACVELYIPRKAFHALLAQRLYPVTRDVRREEFIEICPLPDYTHDVFGHLPLLFDEPYRRFLQRISAVMCDPSLSSDLDDQLDHATHHLAYLRRDGLGSEADIEAGVQEVAELNRRLEETPSQLTELTRFFYQTIEFGMIGTPADFKVQGASLLSSMWETNRIEERYLGRGSREVTPFSREAMRKVDPGLYVFRSFDELDEMLTEYIQTEIVPARSAAYPL